MKKIIIAAAIVFASGLTALSVTKNSVPEHKNPEISIKQSDFAIKTLAGNKSDLGTIE